MGSTNSSSSKSSSESFQIRNHQLFVDGKPFFIKGVCYAPVPIGESSNFVPHGDYFGVDHAYLWRRDLPLIQQLGANVIRVYAWQPNVDHTPFLDAVASAKMKILISFELGAASASTNPVSTSVARSLIIQRFVNEVAKYATHEAVLAWSFGNELNAPWNNYLQVMTHVDNEAVSCNWSEQCTDYTDVNSLCHAAATCAYTTLFSFINEAARSAKQTARDAISSSLSASSSSSLSRHHHRTSPPLIVSGLADVDHLVGVSPLIDKITRFQYLLTDMDAWAVQLYRGHSFGDFFHQFAAATATVLPIHAANNINDKNDNSGDNTGVREKPLMVTEFGVDAFNDMCGWPENIKLPVCFNLPGDSLGGDQAPSGQPFVGCSDPSLECAQPGVVTQRNWDLQLAHELMLNSRWFGAQSVAFQHRKNQIAANIASSVSDSSSSSPSSNALATTTQVVLGGFVMAWSDEYWKGSQSMNGCAHPCQSSDLQACRSESQIAAFNRTDGPAQCRWKSHFSCPNWNASFHDVCGYFLPGGAPDNYVNDEWFGITTPTECGTQSGGIDYHDKYGGHRLNSLTLRPSYFALRRLWRDDDVHDDAVSVASCDLLSACWKCVVGSEVTTGGDPGTAVDVAAQKKVADKCRRACAITTVGEAAIGSLLDRHSITTNDNHFNTISMTDTDADLYSFVQPFIIFFLVAFVLADLYLRRQRRAKANDESTPLLPTITTNAASTRC